MNGGRRIAKHVLAGAPWFLGLVLTGSACAFVLDDLASPPTSSTGSAGGTGGAGGTGNAGGQGAGGFDSDPANCGAPGHDCLGGDCENARCLPYVFDSGYGSAALLLLDDGVLFLSTWESGSVMAIPTDGSPATLLASSQSYPIGLAVDVDYVYYTQWGSGTVSRVPRSGGAVDDLATGLIHPMFLAHVDGLLYVADFDGGAVYSLPTTGGTPTALTAAETRPQFVAAIGPRLLWTNLGAGGGDGSEGAIRSGPLPSGPFDQIASGQRRPHWIIGDETEIFWTNLGLCDNSGCGVAGTGSIMHQLGAAVPEPLLSDLNGPSALWLDGDALVWASRTTGDIFRCTRSGSGVELLASGQQEPVSLVGDAVSLYWATLQGGTIMRLAK